MAGVSIFSLILTMTPGPASCADTIRLSCSAQVFEALQGEGLDIFTEKTGIQVIVEIGTSQEATDALLKGESDLAASAQAITPEEKSKGLVEHTFCTDKMVIITNPRNPITDLTLEQVQGIFSKKITNISEMGGKDLSLTVILPAQNTALYKNFSQKVMNGQPMDYDIMTTQSTFVRSLTRRVKGGISFVNQTATRAENYYRPPATKVVKVNGMGPSDPDYPFYVRFSLITPAEPKEPVNKFKDYIFSPEFASIIKDYGMSPCPCPE
jgi:phosphate transport system substrate-binding protein